MSDNRIWNKIELKYDRDVYTEIEAIEGDLEEKLKQLHQQSTEHPNHPIIINLYFKYNLVASLTLLNGIARYIG